MFKEKLAIGLSGIASANFVEPMLQTVETNPSETVSVVVQIIIGICTLLGLFRKKKQIN